MITLRELLPLLPGEATEEELEEALSTMPAFSTRFELKSGYVSEKTDETMDDRALAEMTNRRLAETNLWWAARFALELRSTSFRLVATVGSTSYKSASKSRDLDFFCVAPVGELWTALTRALVLARAFRVLHPRSPEICFSCIMDEDFAFNLFRREQGPLFARDALEAIVLEGESTYRWFLSKAKWISDFYPNAYSARLGVSPARHVAGSGPSSASKVVERLLFFLVGAYVRAKSRILNGRLTEMGQLDSVFTVRCGSNHLIYESRRYLKLKQTYSSGFSPIIPELKKPAGSLG